MYSGDHKFSAHLSTVHHCIYIIIPLQGDALYIGSLVETNSYTVNIGTGVCGKVDVSENRIRCRPPDEEPQDQQNQITVCF